MVEQLKPTKLLYGCMLILIKYFCMVNILCNFNPHFEQKTIPALVVVLQT